MNTLVLYRRLKSAVNKGSSLRDFVDLKSVFSIFLIICEINIYFKTFYFLLSTFYYFCVPL